MSQRIGFLQGDFKTSEDLVKRDKVCALEVWCEAFNGLAKDFKQHEALEINGILRRVEGWEKASGNMKFGYCGRQRYYRRLKTE